MRWLESENQFLKTNYLTMKNSELARHLDKTESAIMHQLRKLGLKKHKKYKVGDVFNNLTIVSIDTQLRYQHYRQRAKCICVCGKTCYVWINALITNNTKSCGCLRYVKKDNPKSCKKLYKRWQMIKDRCYNTNSTRYEYYGQRGIKMCESWRYSFEEFEFWSINNGYHDSLTIDRIDVNGDYCPENCRWVSMSVQCSNKRNTVKITAFNETKTILEWSKDSRCNVTASILRNRINKKWNTVDALTIEAKVKHE